MSLNRRLTRRERAALRRIGRTKAGDEAGSATRRKVARDVTRHAAVNPDDDHAQSLIKQGRALIAGNRRTRIYPHKEEN